MRTGALVIVLVLAACEGGLPDRPIGRKPRGSTKPPVEIEKPEPRTESPTRSFLAPSALRRIVERLASPEMAGRAAGSEKGREAAEWIAKVFESIGLEPANKGSWFDEFRFGKKTAVNVAGVLRAGHPADDYFVIAAHHDHLGTKGSTVFAGADDNASGVAAVITLAHLLSAVRDELRHNVVFVSFDAEEAGMIGSHRFVSRDIVPLAKTRFAMVFDLLAGSFVPWDKNRVYALGSEHSHLVREVVEKQRARTDLDVRIMSNYILEPAGAALSSRSDYAAYRAKKVPYLFLSTATPWYYHTPFDTPDRCDYEKLSANIELAYGIAHDLLTRPDTPAFIAKPAPEIREAKSMLELLDGFFKQSESGEDVIPLTGRKRRALERNRDELRALVEKGTMAGRDRHVLQRALLTIFTIVSGYRPR